MVDPARSPFHVHREDWDAEAERGELLEDGSTIAGAEAAIEWGRARCDRVLIRLTHTHEGHYSAGVERLSNEREGGDVAFPEWPPSQPPPEGWWTPEDEAAAEAQAREPDTRAG